MPRTHDAEFRRRVVELVRAGRPVRVVAAELGVAQATVYRWKAQDLIDREVKPGLSTIEQGELAAARRRIQELETELALVKQAATLFEEGVRPKAKYPVIAELATEGFSARRCCRILGVAASGFFMWPYPSVRIRVGCWEDPGALVGWGWLSCWLPVMACDTAPLAPPLFLDR